MSKSYGIEFLKSRKRPEGGKIPVMEHFNGLSREVVHQLIGMDPLSSGIDLNKVFQQLGTELDVDLNWGGGFPTSEWETHDWSDGQSVKQNRAGHPVVQWGIFHVLAQEDGRHYLHIPQIKEADEALEFDVDKYFPKSVDEYESEFRAAYEGMMSSTGDVAYPIPHHYTTLFHWALGVFGFELLCEIGMEEDDFHELMNRFAEVTIKITTAWSRIEGLEGFILHDDLCMTAGPVFRPDWYQEHIFPHYPRIFAPLKEKGIPIVFTSDGDSTDLIDDVFAAGADGFNFEYLVDIEPLAEKHSDKILIGNFNNATIASGDHDKVSREVGRTIEIGRNVPGFVANVGGGLTHQMSLKDLQFYLNLRKQLCR